MGRERWAAGRGGGKGGTEGDRQRDGESTKVGGAENCCWDWQVAVFTQGKAKCRGQEVCVCRVCVQVKGPFLACLEGRQGGAVGKCVILAVPAVLVGYCRFH